jgi:chromosome partitioning protein
MTSIALFNNKGRVGKTALTYHLAHMIRRLGLGVLAIDLDPQANLTSMCLEEDEIEELWGTGPSSSIRGPSCPVSPAPDACGADRRSPMP